MKKIPHTNSLSYVIDVFKKTEQTKKCLSLQIITKNVC